MGGWVEDVPIGNLGIQGVVCYKVSEQRGTGGCGLGVEGGLSP